MDYYKYQALGNDYIVIDPNKSNLNVMNENVKLLCDRNLGIGSDGILYGPIYENETIKLRILNPDGSEAEKSGNGIRIFAKYLIDSGYVKDRAFQISTLGGTVNIEVLDENATLLRVDMGVASFLSEEIPVNGALREVINEKLLIGDHEYRINCVTVGNPHCVILCSDISERLAKDLGPKFESNSIFPNRTNVQFLKIMDKNNIQIEIWERGAGYTLASGSSSCAAASVAYKLGLAENKMKVHMAGGVIEIEITSSGHIVMTGSVYGVSQGFFHKDLLKRVNGTIDACRVIKEKKT